MLNTSDYIFVKTTEVPKIRQDLLEKQGYFCPLCGKKIEDAVLDHQHRLRKAQTLGEDGAGMIRGVLCRQCNALEGKVWNAMNRYLQPKNKDERVIWLQNLVEYLSKKPTNLVHPSERAPAPKISKRQYNRLVKVCPNAPEYPASGRVNQKLAKLFSKYGISPFLENTNADKEV